MSVTGINTTSRATDRGTPIVEKNNELDKNAFLKILTTEMTNQDPTSTQDATKYISQLAQFSSLEQMTNLNNTMSFSGAQSLVGKLVSVNAYDSFGQQYGGIVDSISKDGDNVLVNLIVKENGTNVSKKFNLADIEDVFNMPNSTVNNIDLNTQFLLASNMINKKVEVSDFEENESGEKVPVQYEGIVKEVSRKDGIIALKVEINDENGIRQKYYDINAVTKLYTNESE